MARPQLSHSKLEANDIPLRGFVFAVFLVFGKRIAHSYMLRATFQHFPLYLFVIIPTPVVIVGDTSWDRPFLIVSEHRGKRVARVSWA